MNLVSPFRRALPLVLDLADMQRNAVSQLNAVELTSIYSKLFPVLPSGAVHLLVLVSLEELRLHYASISPEFTFAQILGGIVELGLSVKNDNVSDDYMRSLIAQIYPQVPEETVELLFQVYTMTRKLNEAETDAKVRVYLRDRLSREELTQACMVNALAPVYVAQWVYDGTDINVPTEDKKTLRTVVLEHQNRD